MSNMSVLEVNQAVIIDGDIYGEYIFSHPQCKPVRAILPPLMLRTWLVSTPEAES